MQSISVRLKNEILARYALDLIGWAKKFAAILVL